MKGYKTPIETTLRGSKWIGLGRFGFRLVVTAMAALVGSGFGVFAKNLKIFAQSDQKKVSVAAWKTTTDQIKFSNLKVGGSNVGFDEKFPEGDGWVGRTKFDLTNTSDKDIIYLELKLVFPEARPTEHQVGIAYSIKRGNRPGSRLPPSKPFSLPRGSTITIDLAEYFPGITRFVSEIKPITEINQVDLQVNFIVFADETAWAVGTFMHRDPAEPSRYIQTDMPGYNPTKRPRT
jgi:hypothetical protein